MKYADPKFRQEVIAMAQEDARVRDHLASTGELFGGYHPKMEKVHQKNAARLQHIVNEYGWPGQSLLGEDGYRGGLVNSPAGYRRLGFRAINVTGSPGGGCKKRDSPR